MEENTKTQAGGDYEVKEVTALEKVERMNDTDVLLLIRQTNDGSQKCYSVRGYDFHGEDAYVTARKHGFAGTYEDWQSAVQKVVDVQPAANNLAKATEDAEKATADAITATDAIKLIIEQVTETEATRQSNEKARISKETERQEAETARYEAEQVRIAAELERADEFRTAKEAVEKATEGANEVTNHPPYVDQDGYYYKWDTGTKNYDKTNVNLTGKAFVVKKVFASVEEMEATDIDAFAENDFILINTANTEDEDNAKLYVVAIDENGDKFYSYLVDLSGFRGFMGKTPQMLAGTVTSLQEDEEPAVSMTADDVDSEGNPKYKINFGIPKGKSLKYSDLTEEQLTELKKPATDAAVESKTQTALCEAATSNANEASQASSSQTGLCKAATDKAQTIIDKFGDLVAAINIEVTGSGNVLTDVTQTDSKLTFTKSYSFEGDTGGNITELDTKVKGLKVLTVSGSNYGDGYGTVLQFCNYEALKSNYEPGTMDAWYAQIMADTSDKLRFRTRTNGGSWTAWKELINTSSWAYVRCLETNDNRYLSEGKYGLHMNNSDITGCNRVMFNDRSDDATESISFPRSDGKYDAIWAQDGYFNFTSGMSLTGGGTTYTVATEQWIKNNFLPLSGGTMAANSRIAFNSDYLYIGNSSNSGWIRLQDICSANGAGDSIWSIRTNGNAIFNSVTSKNDVVAYTSSDARLKKSIHEEDWLATIRALGGVYAFTYKKDNKDSIGLIAQNLLNTTFADIVSKDDDGYYKVNYLSPKLVSLALGGVAQVDDKVVELKQEIDDLKQEVTELRAIIESLKQK